MEMWQSKWEAVKENASEWGCEPTYRKSSHSKRTRNKIEKNRFLSQSNRNFIKISKYTIIIIIYD